MEQLLLNADTDNKYLFIDSSYYTFFRFHSAKSWYSRRVKQKLDDDEYQWTSDPVFMKTYEKRFRETLVEMQKKFNVPWNNIYFGKDCPRNEIWRREHYPGYKQTRKSYPEGSGLLGIFEFSRGILKDMTDKKGCHRIKCPNAEADDVNAVISRHIRNKEPNAIIYIIANDHDYFQLTDNRLHIVSLPGYKYINKGVDPDYELKLKIIQGDKSDNIPSLYSGCGPSTAKLLAKDKDKLNEQLKNKDVMVQFELNSLLVDFKNIPEHIQKHILESYEKTRLGKGKLLVNEKSEVQVKKKLVIVPSYKSIRTSKPTHHNSP